VASTRTRQRKLERVRYERKMVRQAQRQRRRRQVQAGIGAFVALAVIVVGGAWLGGFFDSGPEPLADPDRCTWLPRNPDDPELVPTGNPPVNPPTTGTRSVTVDLDGGGSGAGEVTFVMDVAGDPCAVASMEHLAALRFFDNSACHELADGALRCGDPGGTGLGGPSYSFFGENLPEPSGDDQPAYPAGTVALADATGQNGSQFLIFYQDFDPETPVYPVLGAVTSGLDVVEAIGAAGTAEDAPTAPVEEVRVRSLTVVDPAQAPPPVDR
jgi:peptidyl-prolyl cis-trans isomerase B (cyclophilin B)